MAVLAMWKCDRDGSMFEDKKQADAYDKMLELGEQFAALVEAHVKGIDEKSAEAFGLLMAENKELIIQACKGKPEVLSQLANPGSVTDIASANNAAKDDTVAA